MVMGFSVRRREVADEEVHTYQLGCKNFDWGLLHGLEVFHGDSRYCGGG